MVFWDLLVMVQCFEVLPLRVMQSNPMLKCVTAHLNHGIHHRANREANSRAPTASLESPFNRTSL